MDITKSETQTEFKLRSSIFKKGKPLNIGTALMLTYAIQAELNSIMISKGQHFKNARFNINDVQLPNLKDEQVDKILEQMGEAKDKGIVGILIDALEGLNPQHSDSSFSVVAETSSPRLITKLNTSLNPNNNASEIIMSLLEALATIKLTAENL